VGISLPVTPYRLQAEDRTPAPSGKYQRGFLEMHFFKTIKSHKINSIEEAHIEVKYGAHRHIS
jgi:hypothetical protein